jgi:hypothetical protein
VPLDNIESKIGHKIDGIPGADLFNVEFDGRLAFSHSTKQLPDNVRGINNSSAPSATSGRSGACGN